ncbi:MAG: hypothetical protein LBB07_01325, partial [Bifidobacteriaceae bacterium]|nr:hypothetical protein [Bifidobacteriaceae bacterium]
MSGPGLKFGGANERTVGIGSDGKFTFANIRLDSEQELTRIISSIDSIAPTFRILGAPRFRE